MPDQVRHDDFMNKPDILKKILRTKLEEIAADQAVIGLDQLIAQAKDMAECRGFYEAMHSRINLGQNAIIAEAKKASPSKGVMRKNFDVAEIAQSYQTGGATCLSVLTDQQYFQGDLSYIEKARVVCELPVIRKDFIIDEYQVYQSRVAQADCILLIVAALDQSQLTQLNDCAQQIGLDVLVEVHDGQELDRALELENVLLGINNRNLRTFETSLDTTIDLLSGIPAGIPIITESGIHTKDDVKLMNDNGVYAFLIGEAFMRAESPGDKLKELFS